MLQIIVAPPRSGKTYFAVNYLCKFTTFDAIYNEYVLAPNVLIISNIEGLKIKHWKIEDCIAKMSLETFFTIENFESIQKKTGKTHIILCIDEAHRIFPKGFSNKTVYDFFAYHGHIGLDVIFMTQGMEEFTRSFLPLFEVVVEVTPRSKAVPRMFTYTYKNKQGKFLYTKGLFKKPEIFGAYQSFRADEHNKPKNALLGWVCAVCLLVGLGYGVFKVSMYTIKQKSVQAAAKNKEISAPLPSMKTDHSAPLPVKSPAPVLVGAVPDSRVVVAWRVYPVQGFFDNGVRRGYLIHGRVVMASACRNYDPVSGIVEYYGGEILPQGGGEFSPPSGGGFEQPAALPVESRALAADGSAS